MQTVKISGMSCQHCVSAVTKALTDLGLSGVQVNLEQGTATFSPTTSVTDAQLREAIDDAGFEVESVQ